MLNIDGTEYSKAGEFSCSHGSGDTRESWSYIVLQGPEGEQYLYLVEGPNHYLYCHAPNTYNPRMIQTQHESSRVGKSQAPTWRGVSRIDWVSLKTPFPDAPEAFKNSREAMIVIRSPKPIVYMSVALAPLEKTNHFVSQRQPAATIKPSSVRPMKVGVAAKWLEMVAAVLFATVLGYGIISADLSVMKVVWSLGTLAMVSCWFGGRGPLYAATHLVAGSFLLYFCTHGIDNIMGSDWEAEKLAAFECGHVLACLLMLVGLRFFSLRSYVTLIGGSIIGGSIAWVAFSLGMVVATADAEFNYFDFFSWYAGAWGWVWPFVLAAAVCFKYKDYKQAPLSRKELRSSLFKLSEDLQGNYREVRDRAPSLARRCDDLSDGLKISSDPVVIHLFNYAKGFQDLNRDFLRLHGTIAIDKSDKYLIQEDFKTIVEDIERLLGQSKNWGESGVAYKSIRFSPFMRTLTA